MEPNARIYGELDVVQSARYHQLEDHPRTFKWLRSPPLVSHFHGHLEGVLPPDPQGTKTNRGPLNHVSKFWDDPNQVRDTWRFHNKSDLKSGLPMAEALLKQMEILKITQLIFLEVLFSVTWWIFCLGEGI